MALSIEKGIKKKAPVIKVTGEVDLYSSPELRSAILDAVPKADSQVAVDLSGVDYMDSSGVATLVEGLRSARNHAVAFTLVSPSIAVMKVLKLAKLERVFEVSQEL